MPFPLLKVLVLALLIPSAHSHLKPGIGCFGQPEQGYTANWPQLVNQCLDQLASSYAAGLEYGLHQGTSISVHPVDAYLQDAEILEAGLQAEMTKVIALLQNRFRHTRADFSEEFIQLNPACAEAIRLITRQRKDTQRQIWAILRAAERGRKGTMILEIKKLQELDAAHLREIECRERLTIVAGVLQKRQIKSQKNITLENPK
jgi:hypothetical protein